MERDIIDNDAERLTRDEALEILNAVVFKRLTPPMSQSLHAKLSAIAAGNK